MAKKTNVWPWVIGGVVVIGGGYLLYRWWKGKSQGQPSAGGMPGGSMTMPGGSMTMPGGSMTMPYVPSSVLPAVPGGAEGAEGAGGEDILSQIMAALGAGGGPVGATTPGTAGTAPTTTKTAQSPTPGGQVPPVGQIPSWAPIATITVPPAPRPVTGAKEAAKVLPQEFQVPGRVTQLVPATQAGGEYMLETVPQSRYGRMVIGEVSISTPSQAAKRTAGTTQGGTQSTQGGGTQPTSFRAIPQFV
jgi:hypothetical protein